MRLKDSFFYTLREDLKDEDSISSNLLTRAGYIKRSSAGIYIMLPLGFKTIKNIEAIIQKEMNKIDSQEMLMPALVPIDVFEQSGRDKIIGDSMYTLSDRFKRKFALAPTHEELFSIVGKSGIRSYKDLPFSLYQFQTKYRDETRARYGLIRVREFIMKDAYTFDVNDEGCEISYQKMRQAYKNIFDQLQLDYHIVTADTGIMGGQLSEEYQAIAPIGEDTIVICENCDFASNHEVAKTMPVNFEFTSETENSEMLEVHTPNTTTIEDVATFLKVTKERLLKTLIYKYDGGLVAVALNGSHDLNESKLSTILNSDVLPAEAEEIAELVNSKIGFIGPVGLNIKTIADQSVKNMKNFVIGANKDDHHTINVNLKDLDIEAFYDLRDINETDSCPNCHSQLKFYPAIEVGNIFKLGTTYSEAFDLHYSDADNKLQPVVMGSYGIGIGRTLAAIAEKHYDENGLNLPIAIAPYKVGIVVISTKNEEAMTYAETLYKQLAALGIDSILDDRNERAGVKFNDMDLIGIPIRITIGKGLQDGLLEFKLRSQSDKQDIETNKILEEIQKHLTL